MKVLLSIALAAALSGCVVAPLPPGRGQVVVQPGPVYVEPYPYGQVYWEPSVQLWFHVGPQGQRYYHPRGWHR